MEEYMRTLSLLGLQDQNLPVFKTVRQQRLASINRLLNMVRNMPRLRPNPPRSLLFLDEYDPEWEDKMVYPVMNWGVLMIRCSALLTTSAFLVYNYNAFKFNPRFRLFRYFLPPFIALGVFHVAYDYHVHRTKIRLFEDFCKIRANELIWQNSYLLDSEEFKRWVYFNEDTREVLERIHRQANNHNEEDFKDSELIVQDFLRRYADPLRIRQSLFPDESLRVLN